MPIKFRCPHCQQFLGISEQKAETITDCPTCGRSIRVPSLDGKVRPLPELKLNLEDEHLRAALGALATIDETPTVFESSPPPHLVSRGEAKIQLEIVPQPASMPIAEPVSIPHVEDVPGQDVPFEESLRQLQDLPVCEPKKVSARKPAIQFGPAAVLGIALVAILLGGVIGRSFRKPASPSSTASATPKANLAAPAQPVVPKVAAPAPPEMARLAGRVTTLGPTGENIADRGSRILLLPVQRIGIGKISGEGFRSGSDEVDQKLLAASLGALGGTIGTADENGNYEVAAPRTGRYCLLIASNLRGREANSPIPDECRKFLETYFDRPEQVLGNVDFLYTEVSLEAGKPASRDVRFPRQ